MCRIVNYLLGMVCLFLVACGGGADDAITDGNPVVVSDINMELSSSPCAIPDVQTSLLHAINVRRLQGGSCEPGHYALPSSALVWNRDLEKAATTQSWAMSVLQFFDHHDLEGHTVGWRVSSTGYAYGQLGENIAGQYGGVAEVVAAWMASPGHCKTILDPAYKDFGGACVKNTHPKTQYQTYWTTVFGAPAS